MGTVGLDEEMIRKYVKWQEKEEQGKRSSDSTDDEQTGTTRRAQPSLGAGLRPPLEAQNQPRPLGGIIYSQRRLIMKLQSSENSEKPKVLPTVAPVLPVEKLNETLEALRT